MWLHTAAIVRYGGAPGIRDAGSVEAALARPYASFGGREMFPGPFAKAAALMESIIQRHPFVDGNKRTATAGAAYLLWKSGSQLKNVGNEDLVEVTLSVAAHRVHSEELTRWFADHAEAIRK